MPGDSLTLDPHSQNEGPTHMVSRQVYESLVTRGIDMSIEPQLATSWETTDPETWVFKLRGGVNFSDGTSLKASDVEFSINRALSGASDMIELIDSITSVKAINAFTVEIKTDDPKADNDIEELCKNINIKILNKKLWISPSLSDLFSEQYIKQIIN